MSMLEIGQPAPSFRLRASNGEWVELKDFIGKKVVLYFYPKDDTPGCTTEACSFRDEESEILAAGAVIVGVSPDSVEKHRSFIKKFNLPFLLLSDECHAVAETYGVWVQKSMYGKTYMGVERATFLMDAEGVIRGIFRKVKPREHANAVLRDLKKI
jgi:thioredoxin-dependent peroxiredoxin